MTPLAAVQRYVEDTARISDPQERQRALRYIERDLTDLLGRIHTYGTDAGKQLRAQSVRAGREKALAREDAELREELVRRGLATEADLDAIGLVSHETLDEKEADGTLEEWLLQEAPLLGRGRAAARRAYDKNKHPKGPDGRWIDTPDAPKPVKKRRKGKKPKPVPARKSPGTAAPTKTPKPRPPGGGVDIGKDYKGKPELGEWSDEGVEEQLRYVRKYGLNEWPTKGPVAQEVLGDARDTQELHTRPVPGNPQKRAYTASRKETHDAWYGERLAGPVGQLLGPNHSITEKLARGEVDLSDEEKQLIRQAARQANGGENPIVLFMAGGPASGKSTVLEEENIEPTASVTINPDDAKEALPEYGQMVNRGEKFAASGVHEESSDMSKHLTHMATDLGLNLVLDGTGDSKRGKFKSKFDSMNAKGYRVRALYVTIPTDLAVVRATRRAGKTGRWVPEPEIRAQHRGVSLNFLDITTLPYVDEIKVYDARGDKPVLIGEGGKGEVNAPDEALFAEFLDKGLDESARLTPPEEEPPTVSDA